MVVTSYLNAVKNKDYKVKKKTGSAETDWKNLQGFAPKKFLANLLSGSADERARGDIWANTLMTPSGIRKFGTLRSLFRKILPSIWKMTDD